MRLSKTRKYWSWILRDPGYSHQHYQVIHLKFLSESHVPNSVREISHDMHTLTRPDFLTLFMWISTLVILFAFLWPSANSKSHPRDFNHAEVVVSDLHLRRNLLDLFVWLCTTNLCLAVWQEYVFFEVTNTYLLELEFKSRSLTHYNIITLNYKVLPEWAEGLKNR